MEIKISGRHVDLTPALEQYASRKVERFHRYFDRISQIEVVIGKDRHEYKTEFIIDVDHHEPIVATSKHTDLYACIDVGADRTVRQLTDHKSKLRDDKHHTPTSGTRL